MAEFETRAAPWEIIVRVDNFFATKEPVVQIDRFFATNTVARHCIVEIGRELLAAKEQVGHGGWVDWLTTEFGWARDTAERYMQVARAFQMPHSAAFASLAIDATALYALASPSVPQDVRQEAIALAESGERITKAKAEEMVSKAYERAQYPACRAPHTTANVSQLPQLAHTNRSSHSGTSP